MKKKYNELTYWKKKSNDNLSGSKLLIDNSYPSTSVHCSYYSNVQLMLHILYSVLNKSEEDINNESKKGSKKNKGFHIWLKNLIVKELAKENRQLSREFNNSFGVIKNLRIQADYKNILISKEKAKKILTLSKNNNSLLHKGFKI